MSEILLEIYNNAYYSALNSGASEEEAMNYAQFCRENVTEYLTPQQYTRL